VDGVLLLLLLAMEKLDLWMRGRFGLLFGVD
jgi:hypothetical protein